ncbi:MAG TPA: isoaspartyl peptidase/L-asparaginase [Burkholderiales bacterium]
MRPVIAIHGGAGRIDRATRSRCGAALRHALEKAYAILKANGTSLDAVTAAVVILEDSGLFNAGRGASLNAEGGIELDASIMEGRGLRAGGVAAVSNVRNPIFAARAVMEHSKHVLLVGKGAERFSKHRRLSTVKKNYFQSAKKSHSGTVGAVALDRDGNLAAATSTGGYRGKLAGRVGDSPLIGAGTWADNRTCAVSCTGVGEFFIRTAAAYDVSARMRYGKRRLASSSREVLNQVKKINGRGGLVAVDRRGNIAMPFNSTGMYRAWVTRDGRFRVAL